MSCSETEAKNLRDFVLRMKSSDPDGWQDTALPMLAGVVLEEMKGNDRLMPDMAMQTLAGYMTVPGRGCVVSTALLRKAASQAYETYRSEKKIGEGEVLRLLDAEGGYSEEIVSDPMMHARNFREDVLSRGDAAGYGFGIEALDRSFGGLYPGEMMVIVGAAGSMKTSLAISAVEDFLRRRSGNAVFVSMDMDAKSLAARFIMRRLRCSLQTLEGLMRIGDSSVEAAYKEFERETGGRLSLIGKRSDGKAYSVSDLREIALQKDADLLVLDYITLIGDQISEYKCARSVMPGLRRLAQDYGTAIIALSQMSRASKADQENTSGNHGAGGHSVEDNVDVEIELKREQQSGGDFRIVASVTKTRRCAGGEHFFLDLRGDELSFGPDAKPAKRAKRAANAFTGML